MAMKQRDELLKIFSKRLRIRLASLPWDTEDLEEIRLRVGQPLMFVGGGGCRYLERGMARLTPEVTDAERLTEEDLQETMLYLCEYSRYAYVNQLRRGFLAMEGGIRVGVAGQYMPDAGCDGNVEYPMFFNIRVPHEKKDCARWVCPYLWNNQGIFHTLILAPPGVGKTTFLRDLIRQLSNREKCRGIAVVDERFEIAAAYHGIPQNDLGMHTDVYSGYDKTTGCIHAIRSMAPEILAVDEIGGQEDAKTLSYAMRCGVSIVATMHAGSLEEYGSMKDHQSVLTACPFERLIWIARDAQGGRCYRLYDGQGELLCAEP